MMMSNEKELFQIIEQTMKLSNFSRNSSFEATLAQNLMEEMSKKQNKYLLPKRSIKTIIQGIATGVPENFQSQAEYVTALMEKEPVLDSIDNEKLISLFMNSSIEKRHFSKSSGGLGNSSWEERMNAFTKDGTDLGVFVAMKAMKKANTRPGEIGKIVFVTSSELQSPGLDVVLIDKLGLPRNVSRDSVNFKGCGGGLSGLALINDYCIANPGNIVVGTINFLNNFLC